MEVVSLTANAWIEVVLLHTTAQNCTAHMMMAFRRITADAANRLTVPPTPSTGPLP